MTTYYARPSATDGVRNLFRRNDDGSVDRLDGGVWKPVRILVGPALESFLLDPMTDGPFPSLADLRSELG